MKDRTPLDPKVWLDKGANLSVFLYRELSLLVEMEQVVARMKLKFYEESANGNVSAARLRVEATDEYKNARKQKAKCQAIEEVIRIAKLQARREGNF